MIATDSLVASSDAERPRVLVVEDEEAIARGLVFNLQRKGYAVELEADGARALERARGGAWDLIVLDVQLPSIDGFQVCRELRADEIYTPILILTARDQPDDLIFGLKTGADDYMVKPFDLGEFLARAESLLRRGLWQRRVEPQARSESTAAAEAAGSEGAASSDARYRFGEFWIDFKTWHAQTLDGVVELPRKELEVLRIFTSRPREVIPRRELLDQVWDLPNHPNERVVDNVIVTLRKLFERDSSNPRHVLSVRGVGYRFVP